MKTKRIRTKAELALLPAHIIGLLKSEPMWSVDELAEKLDYSSTAVRARLKEMEEAGQTYCVKVEELGGIRHYWQLGPKPRDMKQANAQARAKYVQSLPAVQKLQSSGQMRQETVKTWTPKLIRNEFETYFHGPARKEAA